MRGMPRNLADQLARLPWDELAGTLYLDGFAVTRAPILTASDAPISSRRSTTT